jgi:hypothetical protein
MSDCERCEQTNVGNKKRCGRYASCRIGCKLFCWQHAHYHSKEKKLCIDEEPGTEGTFMKKKLGYKETSAKKTSKDVYEYMYEDLHSDTTGNADEQLRRLHKAIFKRDSAQKYVDNDSEEEKYLTSKPETDLEEMLKTLSRPKRRTDPTIKPFTSKERNVKWKLDDLPTPPDSKKGKPKKK